MQASGVPPNVRSTTAATSLLQLPERLMGLIAEAKVPGAVPALFGVVKSYDGEVMAPLASDLTLKGFAASAGF